MLLTSLLTLLGVADTLPPDGPYVFVGRDTIVYSVDTDRRTVREDEAFDLGKLRTFPETPEFFFSDVDSLVVLSDIHGQYEPAVKLLERHGVMNAAQEWTYGSGHLVIVGDVFDRGDRVTELLWLIHDLMPRAEAAGGKVHFLLGNHETMVLKGDDRYVNVRYRISMALLRKTYASLYGKRSYLGQWLRSLPIAVQINDYVFVHGGFNRELIRNTNEIDRMDAAYKRDLDRFSGTAPEIMPTGARRLHGREGPLWYRGYFSQQGTSPREITYILDRLGAERIIVGHTSFKAITPFFSGRVIGVDSSIKFGFMGEVLIIRNGDFYRGTLLGDEIKLFPKELKIKGLTKANAAKLINPKLR